MPSPSNTLKLAVAGLGTVGASVVRQLQNKVDLLESRCGRRLEVTAVSARDRSRDRGCDLSGCDWYDNATTMAQEAPADVFVELIGGADGPAKAACEAALRAGRPVVTANKALIAHHGFELACLAEEQGVSLVFEAAVAGSIPALKTVREGLSANYIHTLHGILNGTCNYILTAMRETGQDFATILREAQELGYAEVDPSFDVDGVDTAHKLTILAGVAFGARVDFRAVHVEGIRHITPLDIAYAEELNFKIKLLGIAEERTNGLMLRVHPAMVPCDRPIAAVEGVFNAVVTKGDAAGTTVMVGRGAGGDPTASSVIADIVDLACDRVGPAFGVPAMRLVKKPMLPISQHHGAYYIRLLVMDRPGVMAQIADILRDEAVSLESVLQKKHDPNTPVALIMTTHKTGEAAIRRAIEAIDGLEVVKGGSCFIRIEDFEVRGIHHEQHGTHS